MLSRSLAEEWHARKSLLQEARVLVIGDLMVDQYLIGDALRISPEAPVPVVKVEKTIHLLGGAGNVARNIAALGGKPALVGVVGDDAQGNSLQELLRQAGVTPRLLTSSERPTTVKTRVMARNQQMLRMDQETSHALSLQEQAGLLKILASLIAEYDIIVVSDYGKGVVTGSLLPEIFRIAECHNTAPKILVDPKPQNKAFYQGAFLLTPNAKETSEASNLPIGTRDEILRAGHTLRQALGASHVLTTLGADGMALFGSESDGVWHVPTTAQQVFDVTGAGDTVIATTALALAAGFPLLDACILANYAAGIVVGKVGASTATHDEVAAVITECPPHMERW